MSQPNTSRVLFSSYRKLKHSNRDAYYKASTVAEMVQAQRKFGRAFYEWNDTYTSGLKSRVNRSTSSR